ncbi:MAG: TonB-dependent receptor [Bacteroidota bacterium]|nr:TonB-dependent receptor [Bacteroidota bacterium]
MFNRFQRIGCFCFLLLFSWYHSNGQQYLRGVVLDSGSREPIVSAVVSEKAEKTNLFFTDADGRFSIPCSGNGQVRLQISYIGYRSCEILAKVSEPVTIPLQKETPELKEVVVIQSNHTTSFHTLTRIDLDLKPVKNTQELLRVVPGLFVAQHAGGGKAEQIFLRGFDCDHGTDIAVSVDGMPVNMVSHAHGQGYADAHFIIPETIRNIDYGTGPYYADKGNLNTAGYVAFDTYQQIPESKLQLESGSFHTFRFLTLLDLLKKQKDKENAYIAAEYNGTNGPTLFPQHFSRYNLFGKYNRSFSENTRLSASISGFSSTWDASGQIPERAVNEGLIDRFGSIDPSEGGHTERYNANLLLSHRFSNNSLWENRAYVSRYLFSLYSDFTFFLNDPVNGDEIHQAEQRNLYGFQSQLSHRYYFNKGSLNSIYGIGIRYDATYNSELSHVVKRQFLNAVRLGDIHESNAFAYLQQQYAIGPWLFDAGLRWDYLQAAYFDKLATLQQPAQASAIFSPKLKIQYTVNKNQQWYVKLGKGFHSNDARVVVANKGQEILPAAYGADLGIILKPDQKWLLNIAVWYLYLQQEFVYVGDDGNVEPSGRTVRKGIDLIARYQLNRHWFAHLNLNVAKPRSLDASKGQDYIPLAPAFSSTGGLFYKTSAGWNGSISYRYLANRPANEDNSVVAKSYLVADAAINYTRSRYEVGVSVENLFNTKWNEAQFATTSRLANEPNPVTDLNFTPGTPFAIRLKLAVSF